MFGEIIENRDSQSSPITNMLGGCMLGFVVRLLFLAWRGPDMPFDSSEYLTLAHNIDHVAFSLDLSAGECSMGARVIGRRFRSSHHQASTA